MKDLSLPHSSLEHQYAKSTAATALGTKKNADHGYAKSSTASSTKKTKKLEVLDPKQRKLSFTKVPPLHKTDVTYISSDSDEPLSAIKSVESITLGAKLEKINDHAVNGLEKKLGSKSPVKKLSPGLKTEILVLPSSNLPVDEDKKKLVLSPKAKKVPTLIQAPGFSRKANKKRESTNEDQKNVKKKLSNCKKHGSVGNEPSSSKKLQTPGAGRKLKKGFITLSSDSDSDLDIPLSKLKTSPKSSDKKQQMKSVKSKKKLSMTERSPKVKISHSKSPKIKDKVRKIC